MTPRLVDPDLGVITPAELAALQAYVDYGSQKEAAHALGWTLPTIKTLLYRARQKANARTTAELVLILRDKLAA